jgi:hypothetical protein
MTTMHRSRLYDTTFSDDDEETTTINKQKSIDIEKSKKEDEESEEKRVEIKKSTKRKPQKKITELDFTGPHGIKRLYEEAKTFNYSVHGNEVHYHVSCICVYM